MSLITDLLKALLPGLIHKKAPYCLWVLEIVASKPVWSNRNPNGNSARRCGKAAKQYVDKGVPLGSIMILPKGILPPTVGGG